MINFNSGRTTIDRIELFGGPAYVELKQDQRGRYLHLVPSGRAADGSVNYYESGERITFGAAGSHWNETERRLDSRGSWREFRKDSIPGT